MKNKKILKALAAMSVGTVMAAGSFSLAACGHKHTWGEDYGKDGANGHYRICTGCDEHSDTEPHTLNNEGECTVCHWTSAPSTTVAVAGVELNKPTLSLKVGASETLTATISPANATNKNVTWTVTAGDAVTVSASGEVTAVKEGTATVTVTTQDGNKTASCTVTVTNNGTVTPPVDKEDVTINISTNLNGNVADGAELVAGSGISAVGALTRNTSTRNIIHPSVTDGKTVSTHRLQLGSDSAGLKINLEANATVLIYASGSNGTTAGSLQLYEGETASGAAAPIGQGGVQADVGVASFEVKANTEYTVKRVKNSGTINVVFIAIHYNGITENKGGLVAAVPAQCGVAGMKAHYLSDYGRYYAEDGTTLKQRYELVEAALTHDYSLVSGSVVAATETATGSAQIKCSHEATAENVVLPVLGSPEYTTRPAEGETGTYTYVYQGVTITFEATGVGEAQLTYTTVYDNAFKTGTVEDATSTAPTTKLYGQITGSDTVTAFTDTNKVTIANNVLTCVDTETVCTTNAYIMLDNAISGGIVKVNATINSNANNNSWSMFQLITADGKEIISVRTVGSNKLGIRCYSDVAAGTNASTAAGDTTVTLAKNTDVTIELLVDIATGTVKATIACGQNSGTFNGTFDKTVSLAGIKLTTAAAARQVSLSNLVVATQD